VIRTYVLDVRRALIDYWRPILNAAMLCNSPMLTGLRAIRRRQRWIAAFASVASGVAKMTENKVNLVHITLERQWFCCFLCRRKFFACDTGRLAIELHLKQSGQSDDLHTEDNMYLEGVEEARPLAAAALAALQRHELASTPDNYAIWYEYHAGYSPNLTRTIDVIISNGVGFDEKTLNDLYTKFFSSAKEEQTVRETSLRVQETLRDVIAVADRARADTRHFGATLDGVAEVDFGTGIDNLNELIQRLLRETHSMAGRNEYVGLRMRESVTKIEALERNLESAIRDATMDGLTGVANRKSFDATLRQLAGDAMNSGDDLALLMVDVDHFKSVNDTWGHQVGDLVLRHVAQTLQQSVRGQDYVARYGGEEFAVILQRTNADSAVTVSDNIRHALAREPLRMELTPPMHVITLSVGVACYEPGDPLTDWVKRSDSALYRAKKEGRNCVRFSWNEESPMPSKFCLITDDSAAVRKIARRLLQGMDFEIDEAEDGQIALDKCGRRMPDAILLDWNMPVMNGIDFLRALRRMEGGCTPRVIFCTTMSEVQHITEAIEAGANEYLIKPFDSISLREKLGELVSA
jgi:diguanylate cyclase